MDQVYVRDGENLAFEVDMTAGGTITRGYFNGVGANEILAIDEVYDTSQIDTAWLFSDAIGTVRTVGRHVSGHDWEVIHRNLDQVGNLSFDFAGEAEGVNKLGDTSVTAGEYFHSGQKSCVRSQPSVCRISKPRVLGV